MENYKTIVALARIKELRKAGDYESAYSLAKDIEVKRISDPLDCNMLLDVYKENSDYDRSIQVAEKIYKRNKSRHALNSLVYFEIKTNDAQRAKEYLEKYEVAAPKDPQRLVFRYRIQKLEKAPYYASRILNIPSSTQITEEEINYVADEVKQLLKELANG